MRLAFSTFVLAAFAVTVSPASAAPTSVPIYPGAAATTRPDGVGMKAPPPSAKTYATSDDFAKVKSWYAAHLKGATEMQQPGMEKTEDAFLVGTMPNGMVVMIQSYKGKTYIVIAPPV